MRRAGQSFGESLRAAKFGDAKCVVGAMLVDEEVDIGVIKFDGAGEEGEAELETVDGTACLVDGVDGGAELMFCLQWVTPLQKLGEAGVRLPAQGGVRRRIGNQFPEELCCLGIMVLCGLDASGKKK